MISFIDANNSPFVDHDAMPASNDALKRPLQLAASVITAPHNTLKNEVLASSTIDGTAGGAGVSSPGNQGIPGGESAECITDTLNARRRVRRGRITDPNTQPSSDKKKRDSQTNRKQNSAGQNGGKQDNGGQKMASRKTAVKT